MEYYNYTTGDPATDMAVGAVAGSMTTTYIICAVIMMVLLIIAWWKIFTKAGEKGWKSLIPIYNIIVMLKIIGMSPWCILLPFIPIAGALIFEIWTSIRMAKVFGKGTGTVLGLIFFPNIFTLILGFGSAEYQGADYGK